MSECVVRTICIYAHHHHACMRQLQEKLTLRYTYALFALAGGSLEAKQFQNLHYKL